VKVNVQLIFYFIFFYGQKLCRWISRRTDILLRLSKCSQRSNFLRSPVTSGRREKKRTCGTVAHMRKTKGQQLGFFVPYITNHSMVWDLFFFLIIPLSLFCQSGGPCFYSIFIYIVVKDAFMLSLLKTTPLYNH
jgi:hypothetical protein